MTVYSVAVGTVLRTGTSSLHCIPARQRAVVATQHGHSFIQQVREHLFGVGLRREAPRQSKHGLTPDEPGLNRQLLLAHAHVTKDKYGA